jgi:hypothetical protein
LRWDPASPQPLIKATAEIKAVMRVVNEVDVVVAGMRLLQAVNDEAQYSLAELVEGLVERFRRCGR